MWLAELYGDPRSSKPLGSSSVTECLPSMQRALALKKKKIKGTLFVKPSEVSANLKNSDLRLDEVAHTSNLST